MFFTDKNKWLVGDDYNENLGGIASKEKEIEITGHTWQFWDSANQKWKTDELLTVQ